MSNGNYEGISTANTLPTELMIRKIYKDPYPDHYKEMINEPCLFSKVVKRNPEIIIVKMSTKITSSLERSGPRYLRGKIFNNVRNGEVLMVLFATKIN